MIKPHPSETSLCEDYAPGLKYVSIAILYTRITMFTPIGYRTESVCSGVGEGVCFVPARHGGVVSLYKIM